MRRLRRKGRNNFSLSRGGRGSCSDRLLDGFLRGLPQAVLQRKTQKKEFLRQLLHTESGLVEIYCMQFLKHT